jgi:hypothetical protein
VSLFHGRWSRRTSLLAAGVLEEAERAAALAHVEACAACRAELQAARDLVALFGGDPVRAAQPTLPVGALVARVQARLAEEERPARPRTPAWVKVIVPLGAVAAAVIALATLRSPVPSKAVAPAGPPQAAVSEDALRRLEASVARDNAVRYLTEAQDVLVTVASAPLACDRRRARVDVEEEARRSRELLSRRALLVEADRAEMAGARPVLEDVSNMLREVAALDPCARPEELLAIQEQMSRRRLLMKIDLMTRELQG